MSGVSLASAHPLGVRRSADLRVRLERFEWLLPPVGFLLALALVISRRPDVVTHAQLWAEDGKLVFADVYNHGLLATLLVPESGYFQTLPVLVAGLVRPLPLASVPLVMNTAALAVRALPVALLLSKRARTISDDLRVRALLAALYAALPGLAEADGNMDNALWFMAVAAVIVLMLAPASSAGERVFDAAILLACATTGVFVLALAPLAIVFRHSHPARVPRSTVAILSGGALLQLTSLLILQHHIPPGFNDIPRISVPLSPSPGLLLQILSDRVLVSSLFGSALAIGEGAGVLLGGLGLLLGYVAFRRGTIELRLFVAFAAILFAMALAHPQGVAWPELAEPASAGRYFIIPALAVAASVVWAACAASRLLVRSAATCLLILAAAIGVSSQWSYPPYKQTGFQAQAAAFERSPAGTRMIFPLNPQHWTMTLVKR
jgi:hypothetical protein